MKLTPQELSDLYTSIVKGSGHPDPMGYMVRIMLTSEGDPDYINVDGKMGLMPVDPTYAAEMVGSTDVATLEGNVISTIAMDIQLFQLLQDLDQTIIAFHDGIDAVGASEETQTILDVIDESRPIISDMLFPPLATVEDVIRILREDDESDVSEDELAFFTELSGA